MSSKRNVLLATAGNLAVPLSALIVQPVLAQVLGVVGRGEVAAAIAPLAFASSFLAFGLPESLTRHLANGRVRTGAVVIAFAGMAGGGVLATVAIYLLSETLSGGSKVIQPLLILAAAFVAPSLIALGLRALSAGRHDWRTIAIAQAVQAVTLLGGVIALVSIDELNILSATVILASAQTIGGLVNGIALIFRKRIVPDEDAAGVGDLYRFGWRVWLGSAAGIILMRLDQLLLTPLSTPEQLGLYSVAASVAEVILLVNLGLRDVIFASQSANVDMEAMAYAARISTFIVLSLGFVAGALAWSLIPALFGNDFSAALPSYYVLSLAMVIGNPASIPGAAISAWGRPEVRSRLILISALVNVPLVLLLVPSMGALGAAIAMLGAQLVPVIGITLVLRRDYSLTPRRLFVADREDLKRLFALLRR